MASLTWFDGRWHAEPPRILSPLDHAFWMASVAFDAARSFAGTAPDLDRHCARLVDSAAKILLRCPLAAKEIDEIAREGIRQFPTAAELYIRPMVFARSGFVMPETASSEFVMIVEEIPMPEPAGLAVCFSSYRRPARDAAPTDAKASCLYPNMQRALLEARQRGCDQAITFDPSGNVAEFATANLWIAKDGVAKTPTVNGTFLNGITRQRVLALLTEVGVPAIETTLTRADVEAADEIFLTSNFMKILPITRLEQRALQPGPIYRRARELYFAFARTQPVG